MHSEREVTIQLWRNHIYEEILNWFAFICLCGGLALLIMLSVVDMKTRLLPNEMVASFAVLGAIFHITTMASFVSIENIFLGAFIGFSTLFLLRAIANHLYKTDTLGLGDVKLIAAGGLWLGTDGILLAMSAGAFAGLLHGIFEAFRISKLTKTPPNFSKLQIPAGPGFSVGLIIVAIYVFWGFSPLK